MSQRGVSDATQFQCGSEFIREDVGTSTIIGDRPDAFANEFAPTEGRLNVYRAKIIAK
jgi:hypothetical protein